MAKECNLFAQLDILLPQLYQTGVFVFCPNILAMHHSICDPVQTTIPPIKIFAIHLIIQQLSQSWFGIPRMVS